MKLRPTNNEPNRDLATSAGMANCTVASVRSTRIPVASPSGKGVSQSPVRGNVGAHQNDAAGDRKSVHTVISVTPKKYCKNDRDLTNGVSTNKELPDAEIFVPRKSDPRDEWASENDKSRSDDEREDESGDNSRNDIRGKGTETIELTALEKSLESQTSLQSSSHSSSSLSTAATSSTTSTQSSSSSSSRTDRSSPAESSLPHGVRRLENAPDHACDVVSLTSTTTTNSTNTSSQVKAALNNTVDNDLIVGGARTVVAGANGLNAQIAEGKSKVGFCDFERVDQILMGGI
ncbi:hypothetical protein Btru_007317 [Bulinus truncatus]|nr:hypothetical protein Btru_007317 [Bulinus truncatus]